MFSIKLVPLPWSWGRRHLTLHLETCSATDAAETTNSRLVLGSRFSCLLYSVTAPDVSLLLPEWFGYLDDLPMPTI
jgi:hypothetical protein